MSEHADAVAQEVNRWSSDASDSAAWDARALVDRLRKSGDHATAIDFGERAIKHWPEFEPLRSAVAWAHYSGGIASIEADTATSEQRQRAKDALARIRALVANDPQGKYSAWPLAALQVARLALTRWPRTALDILEQLDPAQLTTEAGGDYPSNAARWHLGITKALEELGDWPGLLERCDTALTADGLRDDDTRWIRRRRAFALEHLGRTEEAIEILQQLQLELPQWWIEADLARVMASSGQEAEAIEACRRALDKTGKLAPRWRTAALLGDLLTTIDPPLAADHVQLARHLRQREGWPPDKALENSAASLGIGGTPPEQVDISALRESWRTAEDPSRSSGVVKSVLPGDHSGFITIDGSSIDVYFAVPRNSTRPAPPAETHVTFRLVDSFDKKKNQPAQRAIDIRPQ